MAWLYLLLASVAEVGFTTALRLSDGFRNPVAVVAFLACVAFSLILLAMAERQIPLGTAYAVWTGIGAVGTLGSVFCSSVSRPASCARCSWSASSPAWRA